MLSWALWFTLFSELTILISRHIRNTMQFFRENAVKLTPGKVSTSLVQLLKSEYRDKKNIVIFNINI